MDLFLILVKFMYFKEKIIEFTEFFFCSFSNHLSFYEKIIEPKNVKSKQQPKGKTEEKNVKGLYRDEEKIKCYLNFEN